MENLVCKFPDISVVIPVYNSEDTIEICFDSVYNDLKDSGYTFEIIFINDGSTDSSLKLLEKIKKEYRLCVEIISQKNAGVSSARNAGLKRAKGTYIAFCDSDDQWIKDKTAVSMNILKEYSNIKCLAGKHIGKENDDIQISVNLENISPRIKCLSITMQLFKNHFHPPSVILSRDIIESDIFYNEKMKYSEDFDFFNRIVYKFPAAIVDEVFSKAVTNKYTYGDYGLSSNLWEMEKGELYALSLAYKTLGVSIFLFIPAVFFSIAKYIRRCIIVFIRKR